ncbi:MAG: hypothetical protein P8N69_03155 [Flavobacteriales bacterium]|nr:hypothetical protein [Flavobacteriales bacterium]
MPKNRTLNMYRQTKDSHYKVAELEKKDYSTKIFDSYFKSKEEINKENYSDFLGYLKTNGYKIVK